MPNRGSITYVVPAYNEEGSIVEALQRLSAVAISDSRDYEIILVSDGSTDETANLARKSNLSKLRVCEYPINRGKGYALRYGFERATKDYVAFLDGDLDLSPQVMPGYLDLLDEQLADFIIGSKLHPLSRVNYPLRRRILSRTFNLITRVVTGLKISDTQTGCKAFRRVETKTLVEHCHSDGFSFDLELLLKASDAGLRIKEGPVILKFDFTSSVGLRNALQSVADLRHSARWARERRLSHGNSNAK